MFDTHNVLISDIIRLMVYNLIYFSVYFAVILRLPKRGKEHIFSTKRLAKYLGIFEGFSMKTFLW